MAGIGSDRHRGTLTDIRRRRIGRAACGDDRLGEPGRISLIAEHDRSLGDGEREADRIAGEIEQGGESATDRGIEGGLRQGREADRAGEADEIADDAGNRSERGIDHGRDLADDGEGGGNEATQGSGNQRCEPAGTHDHDRQHADREAGLLFRRVGDRLERERGIAELVALEFALRLGQPHGDRPGQVGQDQRAEMTVLGHAAERFGPGIAEGAGEIGLDLELARRRPEALVHPERIRDRRRRDALAALVGGRVDIEGLAGKGGPAQALRPVGHLTSAIPLPVLKPPRSDKRERRAISAGEAWMAKSRQA